MTFLLNAHKVSKSYATENLFEDVSLSIEKDDRIGLLGPNGAGKSTLLKILAHQIEPDTGNVVYKKGLKIGFLEQTPLLNTNLTIYQALQNNADKNQQAETSHEINSILSKLSFPDPHLLVEKLSGGWKKKLALACEIIKKPDILFLDEPTNHLDITSITWLESFLLKEKCTFLTVSHDRKFLENITNKIFDLDKRNPKIFFSTKTSYKDYLLQKQALIEAQAIQEMKLRNVMTYELEWLLRGPKARTTKQQARIKRAEILKNNLAALQNKNQTSSINMHFQHTTDDYKKLIEAKDISYSINEQVFLKNFSLLCTPGKKIAFVGPNGCGKTTLIELLIGKKKPTHGQIHQNTYLQIAYFQQHKFDFQASQSIQNILSLGGDTVEYQGKKIPTHQYLKQFLFEPKQVYLPIDKLSGGEKSRLLIAKLMLEKANLLVLDEPTNDLDMATLCILEKSLIDFPGCVLFVTHDRAFLENVATDIIVFQKNSTLIHCSSIEQLQHLYTTPPLIKAGEFKKKPTPTSLPKKRKLSFHEQQELDNIEHKITAAETELNHLNENLSMLTESSQVQQHLALMSSLSDEVKRLYDRWAELEDLKRKLKS